MDWLPLPNLVHIYPPPFSNLSCQALYPNMEDRSRALSNEYFLNYRINFAGIIEWILLELFHKWRRESNAYQGEFIEFCYNFIECIEQTQIYLNFIVNMWKLSNAYTRYRILTHFSNHKSVDQESQKMLSDMLHFIRLNWLTDPPALRFLLHLKSKRIDVERYSDWIIKRRRTQAGGRIRTGELTNRKWFRVLSVLFHKIIRIVRALSLVNSCV